MQWWGGEPLCDGSIRFVDCRPYVDSEVLSTDGNPSSGSDLDVADHSPSAAIATVFARATGRACLRGRDRRWPIGVVPRTKNGPALPGYGAITMKNALPSTMTTLPERLRRSLT